MRSKKYAFFILVSAAAGAALLPTGLVSAADAADGDAAARTRGGGDRAVRGAARDVASERDQPGLDSALQAKLAAAGFSGRVQKTVSRRLGRALDPELVDLGRLLWFDSILSLGNDNSCSGCHSPAFGFGDSQPMAIGVENNGIVGPDREGPRNQRRTPPMINAGLYPSLMWNARFSAISHDPFDMTEGVRVPFFLGGLSVWNASSAQYHGTGFDPETATTLLSVQANFPPTELVEVAGFAVDDPANIDARLYYPPHRVSSGLVSDTVPEAIPGPNGSPPDSIDRGYSIRAKVLDRLNASPAYVAKFSAIFPSARNGNITFGQVGAAFAEFEYSNTFMDSPLDRYARGERSALTPREKRGALLFFGRAGCSDCHAVAGESNETFSDFQSHVAAIPQIAPRGFGLNPGGDPLDPDDYPGNFEFSGPGRDEDFGREELTGDPVDRYAFRSAPLRNLAVQPAFFHNGAFVRLRDAVRYHSHTPQLARSYDPVAAGLPEDLRVRRGPIEPVLKRLDPRLEALAQLDLSESEVDELVEFLERGLLDPRALPENLCKLIPRRVPSGRKVSRFQGCE